MKNKYVEYIKSNYDSILAFTLDIFIKSALIDELQRGLNRRGANLTVDGILGFKTIIESAKYSVDELLKIVENETTKESIKEKRVTNDDVKMTVMNFLAQWESTRFHYNRGEKSYTTPYGVYKYANRKAPIIIYSDSLFKKYRLNPNSRSDCKRINSFLTDEEKIKIREMAWEFYKEKYMHPKVRDILLRVRWKKSFLTYVSNSVNGGLGRGAKALQSALGIKVDGAIGNGTISALNSYIKRGRDSTLNRGMLEYMRNFYRNLARRPKFARFLKGWLRRLDALT